MRLEAMMTAAMRVGEAQNRLQERMLRVATGKRIQRAAQDVAGMAVATGMKTQMMGYEQKIRNIEDIISSQRVAAGGVEAITGNLQKMYQLAIQASSGLLSPEQKGFIQQEITQLSAEITRVAETTVFNQQRVIPELTAVNLGVSGLNVVGAPQAAISAIRAALEKVVSRGAQIGGREVGAVARLGATRIQLGETTAAWSRIMGTDVTAESIEIGREKALIASGLKVLRAQGGRTSAAVPELVWMR